MAAMIVAAIRAVARLGNLRGRLIVAGMADEEAAGIDRTRFLLEKGFLDGIDLAVIGE